jgi:hypothetical protein
MVNPRSGRPGRPVPHDIPRCEAGDGRTRLLRSNGPVIGGTSITFRLKVPAIWLGGKVSNSLDFIGKQGQYPLQRMLCPFTARKDNLPRLACRRKRSSPTGWWNTTGFTTLSLHRGKPGNADRGRPVEPGEGPGTWRSRFLQKSPVFPARFGPAASETARPPGGMWTWRSGGLAPAGLLPLGEIGVVAASPGLAGHRRGRAAAAPAGRRVPEQRPWLKKV